MDAALDDSEQGLVCTAVGAEAAFGPQMRAAERGPQVLTVVRLGALVQHHGDVCPQLLLALHHALGGETLLRAIDMGAERDAVVIHTAQALQAKDLEPAAVGKDRMRPGHEAVQAAQAGDHAATRAQEQVVVVRQDHRRAEILEIPG